MGDPYIRNRALSEIAFLVSSAGRYREALRASRAIEDCDRRAHSLLSLASAQRKGGDLRGSTSSIAEALEAAREVPDREDRILALTHACEIQAEIDDIPGAVRSIAEALSVAEAIEDEDSRKFTLTLIARNLRRTGDASHAPEVIARGARGFP